MGVTWSAVRMERGMLADVEEPEGRGDPGAWRGATGRVEADEGEGPGIGTVGDGNSGLTESRREKTE